MLNGIFNVELKMVYELITARDKRYFFHPRQSVADKVEYLILILTWNLTDFLIPMDLGE